MALSAAEAAEALQLVARMTACRESTERALASLIQQMQLRA